MASASMPPVLVPPIQSKQFLIGCPVACSIASSSWMRIMPRMPPPSRHRTCYIHTRQQTVSWDEIATCTYTLHHTITHFGWQRGVIGWRRNGVGRINEVTLRRARLVLGWVTCPSSTPGGGTLFSVYVTSHPRPTQPFIISGSINWVVSNFIGCEPVAPSGDCSRGQARAVDSIVVRRVWLQFSLVTGYWLLVFNVT